MLPKSNFEENVLDIEAAFKSATQNMIVFRNHEHAISVLWQHFWTIRPRQVLEHPICRKVIRQLSSRTDFCENHTKALKNSINRSDPGDGWTNLPQFRG